MIVELEEGIWIHLVWLMNYELLSYYYIFLYTDDLQRLDF